jgi:shikimate kinase
MYSFFDQNENGVKMRIYLIGFMGSGKSHTGKLLAAKLGIPAIDLDEQIETRAGKTISDLFQTLGEDRFRALEQQALHATSQLEHAVISCGGGTPCFFDNMQWMNDHGLTIYLHTKETLLLERLEKESAMRPILAQTNPLSLAEHIHQLLEKRLTWYLQAQIVYHQHQNGEDVAGFLYQCMLNRQIPTILA